MSNWDAVMLDVKFFRKHLFLAKIELFKSKFSSFFLKKFGAVPVDRSKTDTRAVKEIFRQLNKGKRLAIFPQATRAKSPIIQGETAKEGVALFAIRNNLPVVPMMYDRKIRPFHKTKLIIGEPIYPDPERKRDKEYLDEFATLVIDKMNELIK